ncbi:MAG: RecQ family zinc-binding domain-containing protein [Methanosarcina sp.]|nr:RecQ family zinc-binding domain-containing protein [Methanosarcina sp.]
MAGVAGAHHCAVKADDSYCEGNKCRYRTLLEYFGEEISESCGNCDSCLRLKGIFDGTEAARRKNRSC